jgi:hypothetical protein
MVMSRKNAKIIRSRTQTSAGAGEPGDPLNGLVYARHGRELMGCKSPVSESCQCQVHWHKY